MLALDFDADRPRITLGGAHPDDAIESSSSVASWFELGACTGVSPGAVLTSAGSAASLCEGLSGRIEAERASASFRRACRAADTYLAGIGLILDVAVKLESLAVGQAPDGRDFLALVPKGSERLGAAHAVAAGSSESESRREAYKPPFAHSRRGVAETEVDLLSCSLCGE